MDKGFRLTFLPTLYVDRVLISINNALQTSADIADNID